MPTNGMRKTASSQAVADEGRLFSGMKPSATTLTTKSASTSRSERRGSDGMSRDVTGPPLDYGSILSTCPTAATRTVTGGLQ